jgi:hypothetical protein
MSKPQYFPKFSHEFEEGPSGPARSYWDIKFGTDDSNSNVTCIALHHRDAGSPEHQAWSICWALNSAFERGRKAKAAEIRLALAI